MAFNIASPGKGQTAKKICQTANLNNDKQIDAVALVTRQLQSMWTQHGGSELLLSSWDGENLQVMFLGGGGCGKTHTILRAIDSMLLWPSRV